jgi:hypothetical protein
LQKEKDLTSTNLTQKHQLNENEELLQKIRNEKSELETKYSNQKTQVKKLVDYVERAKEVSY